MSPVVASRRFSTSRVLSFLFANLVWLAPLFLASATNAAAQITVTTLTDDAGNAANCPGAACSLRDAILAANAAPGSTIVFTGLNGTYTLTSALPAITVNMTLTGPGAGLLTISGAGTIPAFTITAGTTAMTVTMSGMTVANTANGFPPYGYGSGLFIAQPGTGGTIAVNVNSMVFSGNSAVSGGSAITIDAFNQGTVNVTNSTFSGNTTAGQGGAIYNNGTLLVNDSSFLFNTATTQASAIVSVTNGVAGSGVATINESTFANNTVTGHATGYAAVYSAGTLTVANSTFSGNTTTTSGGASTGLAGSIYIDSGTLTLQNTILVEPSSGFDFQCAGAAACPAAIVDGDANGNFDDLNSVLLLSSVGFHGGPTQTFIPQSSSPVVCGGLAADFPGGTTTGTDQRGFPADACTGGKVDAGSVQLHPLVVTTTADSSDGSCGTTCSLRDAITAANTTGSGDISFAGGVTGTIQLTSELPEINVNSNNASVSITGPGPGSLAVAGVATTAGSRILTNNGTLSISGLTFENGNSTNSADGPGVGGAIINAATLSLSNMVFANNSAGANGTGGAIYNNNSSTLTVDSTTFSASSVGTGNGGAIYNESALTVTNSTFSGNTAAQGAAIFTNGSASLDYSTVANNNDSARGAFFNDTGAVSTLASVTFANNNNAGLYNDGATMTVTNNLFDVSAECAGTGCPTSGTAGNIVASTVSALGSYGGPTQTVLPLPGSTAICGGVQGNIPSGFSTDQRGFSNAAPGSYGVANCSDSGSVQTDYTAVGFNAAAYNGSATVGGATPQVIVSLTENGQNVGGVPITLITSGTAGTPTGTTATSVEGTGATFTALTFPNAGTDDLSVSMTVVGADTLTAGTGGTVTITIGGAGTVTTTTTEATPVPASFIASTTAVNVTLSATVKHSGTAVTEGYVTFTVNSGSPTGPLVGTAVGPVAVNGSGIAGATYTIPANTALGTYYVVASYSDPGGAGGFASSSDTSQTITISSAVTATTAVATTVLTQNHAATAFTPVTGSGGTAPLTYGVSPTLPAGLSYNTANGQITGTPTAVITATTFTVTVKDANNNQGSATFSLTVNPAVTATQAIASVTLTQNHLATPFTPVTGAGGTGALAYSIAPTLPNGLSISATTGQITGTPTVALAATVFTVTVTDTNGATASKTFTLTVNGTLTATQSVAAVAFTLNHVITAVTPVTGTGGTTPLTYGVAPALPAGLSYNTANGQITGTPTAVHASSSFTVTVTDANSTTATNTFSLTVNPAVTAAQSVATTVLTQNHAATAFTPVTGGGGTTPLTYGVSPALPAGLNFSTVNGQITGTPTVTLAASTFTVTVTDANGATGTNTFSLTVNGAVTATQAVATIVETVNHLITPVTPVTGAGGTGTLTYAVAPALPTGLSFSTTNGQITGTPTAVHAASTFTVTVTDANNATATNTFSLAVNGAVTATQSVATTVLTQNHAATAFIPVTGSGGTPPLTYGVSPTLPAGLSYNTSTGQVTGTPTAVIGATTFTVTVTDANSSTATATFSLTVNTAVTATQSVATTTLTQNHAATAFTPVTGAGGTTPLTYGVSPTLPAGLSFNTASGQITGTPTVASAATTYTVTVTDANSATANATFSLTVNGSVTATQSVATTVLTQNHAATAFTPVTGSGGTGTLTYGVSPTLPAGLSYNTANGQITGTPTAVIGATTFTVTVTDANSSTATATFSLTVNTAVTATQAVATTVLTQNHAATAFTPVTGAGGTTPLTYGVSPALPAGLSFNTATGQITGTPTAVIAATTFTVTVTDANGATGTNTFSLTVNGAVTATQAVATIVETLNHLITPVTPVTGAGGTGTLTYAVAPALPTGLSFNTANGQITGTPTAVHAASTFTVTVTDANNATANATFTLTVNGALTATQSVATTVLTQNHDATAFTPVTGSGGTPPLSYGVSPALPAGLNYNTASGQITGTPTAILAATTFTVTVTDANSATATATFSLTVNTAVTATQSVASTVLTQNHVATAFTPVTGGGGTTPLTYSVSPALPAGLTMAGATGQITGTPTVASAATTYTVTVTDANNATATATFSLTVSGGVTATQSVASISLTLNHAATAVISVTGSGGSAPLTYGVAPALPAGLSYNTSTGQITGTPTAVSASTIYTVTVTDANSATATATFNLTVNPAVTATTNVPTTVLTQNHAATAFTPVNGGGGTAPLTYGVSPALPAGLSFNTANGQITGTPTAASAATTYTVTVTDANGATNTAAFSLTVNSAVTATTTIATTTLTVNHAATAFTPVTGGGGTAPLAYAVSPTLPAGLSFSTSTGQITGTPTVASAATTYTVTVTDANNATATATFSLTVSGALSATSVIPTTVLTQNHAATAFTPVTGAGGTAPLAFAVSPSLPAGLSYNTSTGQITGTPTAVSASTTYTVTVTDANSATATATFSLTVNTAVSATTSIASTTLTAGHAVTAFTPVAGAGGTAPLHYAVSPALPGVLTMSATTGQITGTPAAASAATTYTVTVSDANNATATATFSLTVTGSLSATTAVPTTVLTMNHSVTAFTPVTGAGGTAPLTYAVSPALPAGLTFALSSGQVTGTPIIASPAPTYTVTVTDANNATATATFSLTVNGALTATTTVASTTLLAEQAATPFTPVTGTGGTTPLTYSVSPVLPAGLTLSSTTGQVSGTPTVTSNATTYTVTVTDANSATATATFSLTVNSAGISITWANPAPITYGTSLAGVLNATVSFNGGAVPGTFVYTAAPSGGSAATVTASTILAAGSYTLTASFTPTDTTKYATPAPAQVPLTVNQGQPTIAWTPATTIGYGTSLSALLNATASYSGNTVAGSFAYTATATGGSPVAVTSSTVLADGSYTLTVTFTPTDTTDYKTATASAPLTVTSQTLTVTANNATRAYGAANPTFTGTITGAVNGDTFTESFATTATATSNVGTYPIVPSATGANLSSYNVVIDDGTLTITQAGTTTTLTTSGTSVNPGASLTLTGTVASATSGTPTGTVSFYDGSTLLNTATMTAGVATYSTTTLSSGSHIITAVYSGDANFTASSTTSPITITVAPLGLTLSATPTTQTGQPGTTFTYQLAVAPAFAGTPYPGTVSFAAAGGPPGAVIIFTPSTLAANAGPQSVAMAVETSATSAAVEPLSTGRKLAPFAFALLLLPLAGTRRMRRNGQRLGRFLALLLLALAGVAATTALSGCGSNSGASKGTDYTITVTATSGSATVNTTVTVTLKK